jgi:hypothetical protein
VRVSEEWGRARSFVRRQGEASSCSKSRPAPLLALNRLLLPTRAGRETGLRERELVPGCGARRQNGPAVRERAGLLTLPNRTKGGARSCWRLTAKTCIGFRHLNEIDFPPRGRPRDGRVVVAAVPGGAVPLCLPSRRWEKVTAHTPTRRKDKLSRGDPTPRTRSATQQQQRTSRNMKRMRHLNFSIYL